MTLKIFKARWAPSKIWGPSLIYFTAIICIIFSCCTTPKVPFCPKVSYNPSCEFLHKKSLPFPPLDCHEVNEDFAKELKIGYAFAKECDFYRAITAFKRAQVLICPKNYERVFEIEYLIMLSYYLGQKYEDVLKVFSESCLKDHLKPSFSAFHDLMVVLYDSAYRCKECVYAKAILNQLKNYYPCTAKKIDIGEKIANGHLFEASKIEGAPSYLASLSYGYANDRKSIKRAEILNALLPGVGYLYVGQKNTALTAFLVNALFIYASYQFFHRGYIAAGAITASLEGGWYFGGIYGGGRAAAKFNEKKYEEYGRKAMDQGCFYPILQLNFVF